MTSQHTIFIRKWPISPRYLRKTWYASNFGQKWRRELFPYFELFNDQINFEEIKYEKIIRGMKRSFLGSIIFGDHPIGFVRFQNQFEFFPELKDRPVTNRTEKSKSQKGRTRSFYRSIFEKTGRLKISIF